MGKDTVFGDQGFAGHIILDGVNELPDFCFGQLFACIFLFEKADAFEMEHAEISWTVLPLGFEVLHILVAHRLRVIAVAVFHGVSLAKVIGAGRHKGIALFHSYRHYLDQVPGIILPFDLDGYRVIHGAKM
ncbi:hypothetical protein SNE25_08465 [Mucilaginibacter sabulilitoris]|uniref:Uncharacterized protein n=1 Tax=Mucilaginibacter sabulilitoris TaxID=1173583 RepID=A0ABZ0TUU1_9SPHI|nr:hypothetical protein [Mucilaginibacter sabulilitoris]WPU95554.1 hypothetical protein SNE25_08465 [Mucilaginibacter sabulilitoris]